jgi:hypothetical protein
MIIQTHIIKFLIRQGLRVVTPCFVKQRRTKLCWVICHPHQLETKK